MNTIALKANKLTKWFGEGESRTVAVDEVSFEASYGKMLLIVGPSGSGKTTLLSMASGILKPDAGEVIVEGNPIWSLSADALADFRLNTVGFVFQDFHLFPRLTTLENVAIPLILKKVEWFKALEIAKEYLDVVGLSNKANLTPMKLSGGERQRVAIARALVSQPNILILDEPTASMDGDTGRKMIELVKTKILNAQRCIIIVTHDSRIDEYADATMSMEDGKITSI